MKLVFGAYFFESVRYVIGTEVKEKTVGIVRQNRQEGGCFVK